jgi:ATP-dependent 26S proteasome regulatory subunit
MSSDPKLTHLVRKLVSFSVDTEPTVDHIVHCLRLKHREYQRKDMVILERQVQKILKNFSNSDGNKCSSYGALTNGVSKANDAPLPKEQQQEDAYDNEAQMHDHQRNNLGDLGNSLNASLTERYRKLQQDRADEAAAVAAEEAQAAVVPCDTKVWENVVTSSSSATVEQGHPKKRSRLNGVVAEIQCVNGKSSKRKKSLIKRHLPSGSSGRIRESNREDGATMSEPVQRPTERYADLGGMEDVLKQIRQLVEYPLVRPELYRHLGVDPPRGVLLRGPPG